MSDILDVLHLWLDGKPTSDVVVWGHSMFWWGRLGKFLQLVAGLVAVIDLVDPGRLRDRGDSLQARSSLALRRAGERRTIRRIVRLREEVGWDFLDIRSVATSQATVAVRVVLVSAPPARVPKGLDLTLDVYRAYHRQVVDQVRHKHSCTDLHKSTCGQQREYVQRRVDELIAARLPPDERPSHRPRRRGRVGRLRRVCRLVDRHGLPLSRLHTAGYGVRGVRSIARDPLVVVAGAFTVIDLVAPATGWS